MIKRKKKVCYKCKLPKFIFSKGLCSTCWKKEYKPPKPAKKAKIKQISEKGKKRNLEYKKAREEFMKTHDVCQVNLEGCLVPYPVIDKSQLQVHHMEDRLGTNLTDQSKFLCVCDSCHRYITTFSKWAIENGFSLPRTTSKRKL